MKNLRKVFALVLAMCMLMGLITVTTYAAEGTYEDPHQLSTTSVRFYITLEAGESQYVQVDDYNGSVISAWATADAENGTDAYFIQYGRMPSYPDADGNASVEMALMGGDMVSVCNSGEETIYVYMSLTAGSGGDTTGTMDDPKEIVLAKNMMGNITGSDYAELELDNEGYHYFITAPSDGKLTINVYAMDSENEFIGWTYAVNNVTAGKYGDQHWSDDDPVVQYETIEVSKDDEIRIMTATYDPDSWTNPEGTVYIEAKFEPVGSWNNPDDAVIGTTNYDMTAGDGGYYLVWTAEEDGTFKATVSGDGWQYSLEKDPVDSDVVSSTDTHWSDDDPVVSSETMEVKAGDEITIWICTYDPTSFSNPAGTVTLKLEFEAAEEESESESTTEEPTTEEPTTEEGTTEEETTEGSTEENTTEEGNAGAGSGSEGDDSNSGGNVNTGDSSQIMLYMIIACVAGAVILLNKKRVTE